MYVYSEIVHVILSQDFRDTSIQALVRDSTDYFNTVKDGILNDLYTTESVWAIEYINLTGKHREPNKALITLHLN